MCVPNAEVKGTPNQCTKRTSGQLTRAQQAIAVCLVSYLSVWYLLAEGRLVHFLTPFTRKCTKRSSASKYNNQTKVSKECIKPNSA